MHLFQPLESRLLFAITYHVSFDDDGTYTAYYNQIRSNVIAAAGEWSAFLPYRTATIELQVSFVNLGGGILAESTSNGTAVVGHVGNNVVNEYAPTDKIVSGVDPNGSAPDGEITIDTSSLVNSIWFDPNPGPNSTGQVPEDMQDGYSIMLHEMGHVLGFNGFRDSATGTLFDNQESTFDKFVTYKNGIYYFNGAAAEADYGGPVPLTVQDMYHVANNSGPGSDLADDLMSGLGSVVVTRYHVSTLDVAILKDTGLTAGHAPSPPPPIVPPPPPPPPPPPTHQRDGTRPTGYMTRNSITAATKTPHAFKVNYSDNVAIKVSTLDSTDIRITGPNHYSRLAHFVSIHKPGDGDARTATYTFTDASGKWTAADNGTYTVSLLAKQVSDTSNNFMLTRKLGAIVVAIPKSTAKTAPAQTFSRSTIIPAEPDVTPLAWLEAGKVDRQSEWFRNV